VRTCLPWQSCHWHHHQHPAGVDAVVALSSLQTLPWQSCGPPFHCNRRPSGPVPFVVRLFRVNLLDCLGFSSRPDGHVTRLCSQWRPSFGLSLLGQPLGALDTQQGQLCFVIQNVARSLLPPVISVPSGLVPLLGRHHPSKSDTGARVCLQHTLTFVMERTVPAPWSPMSHRWSNNKWQGIVRKRTILTYPIAQWPRLIMSHRAMQQQHGCNNIICCQQAAPCAHAHELHIAKAMCTSARAVDTLHCATATSTRPCVQTHDNTLGCMAAMATRPRVQAHNNTSCCTAATATRPCAQAHDNTLHRTTATATRPCAQACYLSKGGRLTSIVGLGHPLNRN
jgi:hypothetical protein